jgi:hypothetical protein
MAKRYMRRLREGEGLREGGIEGSKAKWGSTALLGGTRWGHHRNGTRSAIAIGTCICRIAHDFESRFRVPHSPSISLTSPHLITHLTQLVTSLHTYLHTTAAPRPGCIASHHHNKRLPGRHAYIAVVSLVCPNLWAERGCLPRALPCVSPAPTTSLTTLPLPTPYSSRCPFSTRTSATRRPVVASTASLATLRPGDLALI